MKNITSKQLDCDLEDAMGDLRVALESFNLNAEDDRHAIECATEARDALEDYEYIKHEHTLYRHSFTDAEWNAGITFVPIDGDTIKVKGTTYRAIKEQQ
jgi:hypothetical protein